MPIGGGGEVGNFEAREEASLPLAEDCLPEEEKRFSLSGRTYAYALAGRVNYMHVACQVFIMCDNSCMYMIFSALR